MFQIKYNGGFLDLGADQKLEFERENPMFILEDYYKEYSTPIVIKFSENNVALLGGIFFDTFTHQQIKVDVEIWDKGTFDSNVTLVVDKANTNSRNAGKGDVNGYLLDGISRLFLKTKFTYLASLNFGGVRTITDFYTHFTNTWDNTYDYIVAPVRNDALNGTVGNSTGWMNDFWNGYEDVTNVESYEQKYACIFPRLKFVFIQIFKEHGFSLDTSEIDGSGWENLFMLSLKKNYLMKYWIDPDTTDGGGNSFVDLTSIDIDISTLISPEITCAYFIQQLCYKYAWTLLKNGNNSFKIIALKDVKNFDKLDITPYISDSALADFSQPANIFSFENVFPSDDALASAADASGYIIEPPVIDRTDLPDLSSLYPTYPDETPTNGAYANKSYDKSLVYVYNDNKFYKVGLSVSTVTDKNNLREWQPFLDNIYNYKPNEATVNIKSDVTTLPVYWTQHRKDSITGQLFYGYFPAMKQPESTSWGIRTLLYLGLVNEKYYETGSGPYTEAMQDSTTDYTLTLTEGSVQYPLLSSVRNNGATDILPFSNVFTHPKNGTDYGIIAYWFQKWIDATCLTNIYEENIYLPKQTVKSLTYDTLLTIKNIPYLLLSYTEPIPYKGFILAKLRRIAMNTLDRTAFIGTGIFLKFSWENEQSSPDIIDIEDHGSGTYNIIKAHPIVRAYADPYSFTPPTVDISLMALIMVYETDPNNIVNPFKILDNMFWGIRRYYYCKITSNVFNLATATLIPANSLSQQIGNSITPTSDGFYIKSYTDVTNAGISTNVVTHYKILATSYYNVIPDNMSPLITQ